MRKAFAGAMLAVAAFGSAAAFAGDDARAQQRQVTRFEWKAPFTDMSPQGAAIIAEAMQALVVGCDQLTGGVEAGRRPRSGRSRSRNMRGRRKRC